MNVPLRFWMLSILLCTLYHSGITQNYCGTTAVDQQKLIQESDFSFPITESDDPLYIPLQIHNVGNDNGQSYFSAYRLYESLCTLNEDFLETGIQFFLESDVRFINKTSWNDHAKYAAGEDMMRSNNVFNRANCYIVNNPAGNCGYYTYDGDGVALSKSCLGKLSHTWAHELGHFFSLPHTFFGWEGIDYSPSRKTVDYQGDVFTNIENVIRANCNSQADNFCDTPPDYISTRWTCNENGLSPIYQRDTRDSIFKSDGTLFMSYSNEQCMKRFSTEQIASMHRNLQRSRAVLNRPLVNVIPRLQGTVELVFPPDSSILNKNLILCKWNPVPNAKYYLFRLARTSNFSVVVKNIILTETQVVLDTLVANAHYYWDVKAVSDFDFCGVESVNNYFKTESLPVGTEDTEKSEEIQVYPNPVFPSGIVTVRVLGGLMNNPHIQLLSIDGSTSIYLHIEKTTDELYVCTLPDKLTKGLYILRVSNNTMIFTRKVIVN